MKSNQNNACQDSRENRLNTIQEGLGQFQRHAQDFTVTSIDKKQTYDWLLNKHYAKRIPSINYSFGLYEGKNLVGVSTFGYPANRQLQMACGEKYADNFFELNRLIKNDNLPKNTQTFFIGRMMSLLPKPMIVVSYADPNTGHNGYSYQASNFIYTGLGGTDKEYEFNNYTYTKRHMNKYWFLKNKLKFEEELTIDQNFVNNGGRIIKKEKKHRYMIFLGTHKQKKEMKKTLVYPVSPYPKGNNKNYDRLYKPVIQQDLFV